MHLMSRVGGLIPIVLMLLGVSVMCGMQSGCEATPATGRLDESLVRYNAGQYQEAYDGAMAALRGTAGEERAQANYLAGLSAFRLGRLNEAERLLLASAASSDPTLSGRSRAIIGLIRMEQDRPLVAAEEFKAAARLLDGNEAAEAAYRAGMAYQAAGDWSSARAQFTIASARGGTGIARQAEAGIQQTGFTIQVGAYANRENAERAAAEHRPMAERHGLGAPRIVPRHDSRGQLLYIVQFGQFGTQAAAERELATLNNRRLIVARTVRPQ